MEKIIVCKRCLKSFKTLRHAKYCLDCRKAAYKESVLILRARRRKDKMTAAERKYEEKALQKHVRYTMEAQKLRRYSDEKFYAEVTQPILKQLDDMGKICEILDEYKQEDRVRMLKELLARISWDHKAE